MALVSVLALGRPGCGKTTAYHRVREQWEKKGWTVSRFRDYEILRRMFENDSTQTMFRPTEYDGFDVLDFSVLYDALIEVERQVRLRMLTAQRKELAMIELARDDYRTGLKPFSAEFLRNSHILFIDADIETCMQRIHQRVLHGGTDRHFVSDQIMRSYYAKDNLPYMSQLAIDNLERRACDTPAEKVIQVVRNNKTLEDFHVQIDGFVEALLEQEKYAAHSSMQPVIDVPSIGMRHVPGR